MSIFCIFVQIDLPVQSLRLSIQPVSRSQTIPAAYLGIHLFQSRVHIFWTHAHTSSRSYTNIQTHKPKQSPHLALNTWFLFLFTADTMHTLHLPLFSFLRFSTRHSYLIFRYLPMLANGLDFLSSSLSSNLSLRAHYWLLTHHFLWCLKCSWWLALLLCRTHFSLITRGPH